MFNQLNDHRENQYAAILRYPDLGPTERAELEEPHTMRQLIEQTRVRAARMGMT